MWMDPTVIHEDGLELRLAIAPLSFAKVHEDTVEELVARVSHSMLSEGMQIDPVIVDGMTGVILDGMHRRVAAEKIGLDKLLICRVNYRDPKVLLKRWVRVSFTSSALLEDLKVGLRLIKVEGYEEAIRSADSGASTLSLLTQNASFVSPKKLESIPSSFWLVRKFDELCRFHGKTMWPAKDVEAVERAKKGHIVLYVPRPRKKDGVKAALYGPLFPPKYTRHIIPARPVGIGFPLRWLRREVGLKLANEELKRHLERLKVKRLPPKSVYMGRIYDEVLYVFGGR